MYTNMIKSRWDESYRSIQGINNISKVSPIKKEKYTEEYIEEKTRKNIQKSSSKNQDLIYKPLISFKAMSLNGINKRKTFICRSSINPNEVYKIKEDGLGKNIDAAI